MRITLSSFSPGLSFGQEVPQSRKSDEKSVRKFPFNLLFFLVTHEISILHRLTLTSKTGSKNNKQKPSRHLRKRRMGSDLGETSRAARRGPRSNGLFAAGSCSGDPNVRGFGGYPISADIVVPGHPLHASTHSTFLKSSIGCLT
jgi:hypothetical protein